MCANGHTIDPTWNDCPYCKAQAPVAARSKTVVEAPVAVAARPVPPPPPPPVLEPARRMTVYVPAQETTAQAPVPRAVARKIVGVLISYSWRPEGQMFPIREGRNLIGRGSECEVQVSDDPTLSHINTHITFRKTFTAGDMVSMSGTDINGVPAEEQFVAIESGARLRTGSTQWTFLAIPAAQAE